MLSNVQGPLLATAEQFRGHVKMLILAIKNGNYLQSYYMLELFIYSCYSKKPIGKLTNYYNVIVCSFLHDSK